MLDSLQTSSLKRSVESTSLVACKDRFSEASTIEGGSVCELVSPSGQDIGINIIQHILIKCDAVGTKKLIIVSNNSP